MILKNFRSFSLFMLKQIACLRGLIYPPCMEDVGSIPGLLNLSQCYQRLNTIATVPCQVVVLPRCICNEISTAKSSNALACKINNGIAKPNEKLSTKDKTTLL